MQIIKIFGIIFAILIVSYILFRYMYKHNMFQIRNWFVYKRKSKNHTNSLLTDLIILINGLGKLHNILKVSIIDSSIEFEVHDTSIIENTFVFIKGKKCSLTYDNQFELNNTFNIIKYAIKK